MTPRVKVWMADLEREQRAGVPHFRTGQIRAWRPDDDTESIRLLRFVDRMGHAWLVCCDRETDTWTAELAICVTAGGMTLVDWGPAPPAFRFTEAIVAALDDAEPIDELPT